MRIVDETLLDVFRQSPRCEWCRLLTPTGCDPHHIHAKGFGGGGRLDVAINLIALCRECHTLVHGGFILRRCLLAIVAQREGRLQDDIEAEIMLLRRLPKGSPRPTGKGVVSQ